MHICVLHAHAHVCHFEVMNESRNHTEDDDPPRSDAGDEAAAGVRDSLHTTKQGVGCRV